MGFFVAFLYGHTDDARVGTAVAVAAAGGFLLAAPRWSPSLRAHAVCWCERALLAWTPIVGLSLRFWEENRLLATVMGTSCACLASVWRCCRLTKEGSGTIKSSL